MLLQAVEQAAFGVVPVLVVDDDARLAELTARGQASLGERALKLERRPLQMLQLLAGRPGEVVGRAELLERVWGTSYKGFEHSVEQAVHELRRALNEPGWIETVRGIGYRFVAQP